jgi:hypothetical protein
MYEKYCQKLDSEKIEFRSPEIHAELRQPMHLH